MSRTAMWPYFALRALMGVGLLVGDRPMLAAISGRAPDGRERAFAVALGARQVVEAIALWRRPTAAMLRTGAAVDALHGVSTAWLIINPRRRRLALINLICAGGFTLAGCVLSERAGERSRRRARTRCT